MFVGFSIGHDLVHLKTIAGELVKDFLAFVGMMFLTAFVVVAVGLLAVFYQNIGMVSLPEGVLPKDIQLPQLSLDPPAQSFQGEPTIFANPGIGHAEWSNPLDALPTATEVPTAIPTATPVPPLSPEVYQAQAIARMKDFAAAMQTWVDANDRLSRDSTLKDDMNWKAEMEVDLQNISATAQSLAAVGPAPAEYEDIYNGLQRVNNDAQALSQSYQAALDSGSSKDYIAAGEAFKRVKDNLTHAVEQMVTLGWTFQ